MKTIIVFIIVLISLISYGLISYDDFNDPRYTRCEASSEIDFNTDGFQVGDVICAKDTHQYVWFRHYGTTSFAHWESCKYCNKRD